MRRLAVCLLLLLGTTKTQAQMVTGSKMPGFDAAFALEPIRRAKGWTVRQVAVAAGRSEGANVLWPGETVRITLRFTNTGTDPLAASGSVAVIGYSTSVPVGDVWTPRVARTGLHGATPIAVRVAPGGAADVTIAPRIPARFGGYVLVADLGGRGRAFCAALVRVARPDPGRVQFPTYSLDLPWPHEMTEAVATLFKRIGVKGCRMGAGYTPTTAPDFEARSADFFRHAEWARKHQITVMLTVGEGGAPMPLGRPRHWLTPDAVMMETKSDYAWLPEYDPDFQRWSRVMAGRLGWPKGPVNAMELWNEPWEGISISGWGADMLRYREMFEHMARGIEEARSADGVQVLIGGAGWAAGRRRRPGGVGGGVFGAEHARQVLPGWLRTLPEVA